MDPNTDEPKAAILAFLERIGLQVRREPIAGKTFMPGVTIREGALVVDDELLLYPGDLLHEAGHLAMMSPAERAACLGSASGDEMSAIAWSYAAALEIGLDPLVVFHPDGYQAGGASIVENFREGRYFGVPLLQYYGLTKERLDPLESRTETTVFPRMRAWLRTSERADDSSSER
jgi:hypothetical protein